MIIVNDDMRKAADDLVRRYSQHGYKHISAEFQHAIRDDFAHGFRLHSLATGEISCLYCARRGLNNEAFQYCNVEIVEVSARRSVPCDISGQNFLEELAEMWEELVYKIDAHAHLRTDVVVVRTEPTIFVMSTSPPNISSCGIVMYAEVGFLGDGWVPMMSPVSSKTRVSLARQGVTDWLERWR